MPLTTCNQKEVLFESKLNGFLGGFLLHLVGLRNFRRGEGRGSKVSIFQKLFDKFL